VSTCSYDGVLSVTFQASSTTATDASTASVSRSTEECSICGQQRDVKCMAKHLKAHERYSGNTNTDTRKAIVHPSFGLQHQEETGRAQATARAVYTSSQQHLSEQNWMVRRASRRIYPYLCIDAHVSTLRRSAGGEMSTLPDSTVEAVIMAGRTFVKEVKRQFGGVTPRFHPKVARGTDNQPCHAPEEPEGDSTCEVTQTMEPPIALIAVNDDIDEFNTVSGASEEQHVQPSRRVVMRGTPTTETAAAGRLNASYTREELMKRHHIRKSTGQVPVQNRPWSAQSTNSVATTPEISSHCMQFTGNASNTLARTSQSKRAHHDDKSGHRRMPAVSAT